MTNFEGLFFRSMYTDGSWARSHSLHSLLLNQGVVKTGGASVIHTNRGLLTVKISMDVDVKSAFDAEVVSLLIAHEIAGNREVAIWSDCNSAIKCLNGGGLGSYSQLLSGWKKSKNSTFNKVKAHPEMRLPAAEWSREEQGNFLADKVAGDTIPPMITISASEWLLWIGSKSKIIIADALGMPVVLEPRFLKSKKDCVTYLDDRDRFRIKDGKIACWKGANIAYHHRLMGRSNKVGDRVITQRIGLIKRWQWSAHRDGGICSGCNNPIEGIDHPLRRCSHIDMVKARADWWRSVDGSIMKCNRKIHERLFKVTRAMREEPGGEIACCGSFLPSFVSSLNLDQSPISDADSKAVIRILKAVSGGARTILRTAAELQLGLGGVNWRQSAITQFFKPTLKEVRTKIRRSWADSISKPADGPHRRIDKTRIDPALLEKNRNLNVHNVFDRLVQADNTVYWEFKAG
jgi:hypothetical protein